MEIYELKRRDHSARAIARELGLARNTVLRSSKSPEAVRPKPRPLWGSKPTPTPSTLTEGREGLGNCQVLPREIRELGYDGVYILLMAYGHPGRRARQPQAAMRVETGRGDQAQVDRGSFSKLTWSPTRAASSWT